MAERADRYSKLAFVLMASDQMSSIFEQAVQNANGSLSKFEVGVAKIGQKFQKQGTLLQVIGKQIGSTVLGMVKESIDYSDSTTKMAQSANIQVKEFQKLAYAANLSDVSNEELTSSFNRLNKFITSAVKGSKEQLQIFEDLGISIYDAAGKVRQSDEIFKDFATTFSTLEENAAKSDLEQIIWGKSGTKLADLLNQGRVGIEKLGIEAEKAGLVFDNTNPYVDFNDTMEKINKAILGTKLQISSALLPVLEKFTGWVDIFLPKLTNWISENKTLTKYIAFGVAGLGAFLFVAGSLAMGIGGLSFIFLQFGRVIRFTSGLFTAFKNSMMLFRVQYAALIVWQKLAAAAQWLFNASLFGCPIVWIIAGITALTTVTVLLVKHWTWVSDKLTKTFNWIKDKFITAWNWIKNILDKTPNWILVAIAALSPLIGVPALIIKNWDKISAFFVKLWDKVKNAFSSAWNWIKNMFLIYTSTGLLLKHWDKISDWFAGLWDKTKQVFSSAWDWIKNMFLSYTPTGLVIKHWDKIPGFFAGLWDNARNIFSEKWATIGEFFSGLKTNFYEYGKNILSGLTDGVKSMVNQPVELIKSVGEKVKNKFKSILGINSPSRIFAEFGINITKGLTGGIDYGLPAIASTSGNMAMQAVSSYGKSFQMNIERIESISGSRMFVPSSREKSEPIYVQLQQGFEQSVSENNIIPASQIFNNSNYHTGGSPINYNQNITFSGNMSETDKQDFSKELRQHANDVIDIMKRFLNNKERLSFNS